MKLSFVIPAYNSSSTILRCLDSIYALPFEPEQFEVIVIDDCSTDNTREIVSAYAETKHNVKLLCQAENHRQGAARNRGIHEAQGKYICFADSDDEMADGLVDALELAESKNLDMVFLNTAWENENFCFEARKYDIPKGKVQGGGEFANSYYDETCVGVWSYLWKRSFLVESDMPFVEDRRMEDYIFVERHIVQARRIAYFPVTTYLYHFTPGSTVRQCNVNSVGDTVFVCYLRWSLCDSLEGSLPNFTSKVLSQCKHFVSSSLSLRRLTRFTGKEVRHICEIIGVNALPYLEKKNCWNRFTLFCMKHHNALLCLISIAHPIASFCRKVKRKVHPTERTLSGG